MPPYPPHRPVGALEARAADLAAVAAGLPSLVLMEHAGRGLAVLAFELRRGPGPVAILCGPGGNGGDGYACARFLASFGVPTRVLRFADDAPRAGDARVEHDLAARATTIEELPRDDTRRLHEALRDASLVVDALFGVGRSRPLAAPYVDAIEAVNAAPCARLSADLPSGLDADDGRTCPVAVSADVTAAMGLPKLGCFTARGAPFAGQVVEVDVGLPAEVHGPYVRTTS